MNLPRFLRRNGAKAALTHRLTWFELQISPHSYRFAIVPKRPILIGLAGDNDSPAFTSLIRYDRTPDVFEKTVEQVDALIKRANIMGLTPREPHMVFADEHLKRPGVHLRFAYADDNRWAGHYEPDQVPAPVLALVQDTKDLAHSILKQTSRQRISGQDALEALEPNKNAEQESHPSLIVKVRISRLGTISVNDREVSLAELRSTLDDLQGRHGGVWYYRDDPDQEPTEATTRVVQEVLEAITTRRLPVRLQSEKY
jgi:hypothetical protein